MEIIKVRRLDLSLYLRTQYQEKNVLGIGLVGKQREHVTKSQKNENNICAKKKGLDESYSIDQTNIDVGAVENKSWPLNPIASLCPKSPPVVQR